MEEKKTRKNGGGEIDCYFLLVMMMVMSTVMMAAIDGGGKNGGVYKTNANDGHKNEMVRLQKKRSHNYKMKYIFACSINRQTVKQTELKWREVM